MVLQETKIRLSKVVRLRDAFTGEPVSAGIELRSLAGGGVEKKGEGYFLLLDVGNDEFQIEVKSPVYQRQRLVLKADRGEKVKEILLYPSFAYPFRQGTTSVRGRAKPKSVVKLHAGDAQAGCRMIGDYKRGQEEISFYLKGKIQSVFWYIRKKQKEKGEYFCTEYPEDEGETYRLRRPLKDDYMMKDSVICPAQECIADEDGEFYLLLADIPKDTSILKYSCESEGKVTEGEAEIFKGRENYILLS